MTGDDPLAKTIVLSEEVSVLFQSCWVMFSALKARSTPGTESWLASPESGIVAHNTPVPACVPFDESEIIPPGMPSGGITVVTELAGVLSVEPLKPQRRPKSFSPQM